MTVVDENGMRADDTDLKNFTRDELVRHVQHQRQVIESLEGAVHRICVREAAVCTSKNKSMEKTCETKINTSCGTSMEPPDEINRSAENVLVLNDAPQWLLDAAVHLEALVSSGPAVPNLPKAWSVGWSAEFQQPYYYSTALGVTQWEFPREFEAAPAADVHELYRAKVDAVAWREQERLEAWAEDQVEVRKQAAKAKERARETHDAAMETARDTWRQLDLAARAELMERIYQWSGGNMSNGN
mmetsp:Transcript_51744/g.85832  ORF Transcript_51744/g.85832 Transcript_51744/m.85832 type:complete len:243 (+) Transcript_51744:2-730(+)